MRLLLIKFSADIILLVFPSGSSCYASLIAAEGPKFEENNKLRGEKPKTGVTLGYWRGRKTLTDRTCTRHTSTSSLLFVVAVFTPLAASRPLAAPLFCSGALGIELDVTFLPLVQVASDRSVGSS